MISDTIFHALYPQIQRNRWKWDFVNWADNPLPPASLRGQAVGTGGEEATKASTFLHRKSRDEEWMLSVERDCFNKEGFEVQSFLELRIWEALSAEARIKKNYKERFSLWKIIILLLPKKIRVRNWQSGALTLAAILFKAPMEVNYRRSQILALNRSQKF